MPGFHLFDATNSIDHVLAEGKTVAGRSAECDIRLISSSVSRKHALFEVNGDELVFSDLGSSNGSFVNKQPVKTAVRLKAGDRIVLGDFSFTVSFDGEQATAATDTDITDRTQLMGSKPEAEIPQVWSENAGLENASGTQIGYFSAARESQASSAYRAGTLELPPMGDCARLVALSGAAQGQIFPLARGDDNARSQTWKIGRDADTVDLLIPDASVSGQHAQLVNEASRWKIVNWMSTNGTFVNGTKGLSTYLNHGDIIRMGSAELAFELPGKGGGKTSSGGGLLGRLLGR